MGEFNTREICIVSELSQSVYNPVRHIKYGLLKVGKFRIMIYNVLGQEVLKVLSENKPAGYYVIDVNAENPPSGVYFYRIQTDQYSNVKKMVVLR